MEEFYSMIALLWTFFCQRPPFAYLGTVRRASGLDSLLQAEPAYVLLCSSRCRFLVIPHA